jgi:hypothetical protein
MKKKMIDTKLDLHDVIELAELCYGPDLTGSVFASRKELEAAWQRHRVAAMAVMKGSGHKPAAWEEFERPRRKKRAPKRLAVEAAEPTSAA